MIQFDSGEMDRSTFESRPYYPRFSELVCRAYTLIERLPGNERYQQIRDSLTLYVNEQVADEDKAALLMLINGKDGEGSVNNEQSLVVSLKTICAAKEKHYLARTSSPTAGVIEIAQQLNALSTTELSPLSLPLDNILQHNYRVIQLKTIASLLYRSLEIDEEDIATLNTAHGLNLATVVDDIAALALPVEHASLAALPDRQASWLKLSQQLLAVNLARQQAIQPSLIAYHWAVNPRSCLSLLAGGVLFSSMAAGYAYRGRLIQIGVEGVGYIQQLACNESSLRHFSVRSASVVGRCASSYVRAQMLRLVLQPVTRTINDSVSRFLQAGERPNRPIAWQFYTSQEEVEDSPDNELDGVNQQSY